MQAGSLHYACTMEQIHRRTLPHWYKPSAAHFVTYRVADTLPPEALQKLRERKESLLRKPSDRNPADHRQHVHKLLFAAYEAYLDRVTQRDWLREPRIASMLRENLYFHHAEKYVLHAFCIMPNHVHVLLTPSPEETVAVDDANQVGETSDKTSPLSSIMHSLKSYTANQANRIMKRSGRFWQPESYDHWVRDDIEFERIVNYIRANPVVAGLVQRHEDWYWSSCHDRFLTDGDTSGYLLQPT